VIFSDLFRVEILEVAMPKMAVDVNCVRPCPTRVGEENTHWLKIFLHLVELLCMKVFIEIVRNITQHKPDIVC
jgi:hypothetical protein